MTLVAFVVAHWNCASTVEAIHRADGERRLFMIDRIDQGENFAFTLARHGVDHRQAAHVVGVRRWIRVQNDLLLRPSEWLNAAQSNATMSGNFVTMACS